MKWLLLTSAAVVTCLTLWPSAVHCSVGDRSRDFRQCVLACTKSNCSGGDAAGSSVKKGDRPTYRPKEELPLHLWLLGWDCRENCEYECMRIVTSQDLRNGVRVRQFHGKVGGANCLASHTFFRMLPEKSEAEVCGKGCG